jgi:hypothetical protein
MINMAARTGWAFVPVQSEADTTGQQLWSLQQGHRRALGSLTSGRESVVSLARQARGSSVCDVFVVLAACVQIQLFGAPQRSV